MTDPRSTDEMMERLLAKAQEQESGCLEWMGHRRGKGYGTVTVDGKHWGVHRLAWTLRNGPIPDGMFICHHCDNPPCFRDDHLFLGTPSDNSRDMFAKGRHPKPNANKTECLRGHPYTPENTVLWLGKRACRMCRQVVSARGARIEKDARARSIAARPRVLGDGSGRMVHAILANGREVVRYEQTPGKWWLEGLRDGSRTRIFLADAVQLTVQHGSLWREGAIGGKHFDAHVRAERFEETG